MGGGGGDMGCPSRRYLSSVVSIWREGGDLRECHNTDGSGSRILEGGGRDLGCLERGRGELAMHWPHKIEINSSVHKN